MSDLDPEAALLGIVLNRPKVMLDLEDIAGDDFGNPRHAALWDLMLWLTSQRMPPDPVTVSQHLSRITLPGIDAVWIAGLVTGAPIGGMSRHYGHMVTEAATRRRLISAGTRIVQLAEGGGDSQEIAEIARLEVDASSRAVADVVLIGDEIDVTLDMLEEKVPSAVPSPWPDLNRLIQGWRPGGLYVIGARPGVGKSIAALQIAVDLSKRGFVAFHSLEMPRVEVHTRVIAQLANVDQGVMSRREMSELDWQHVSKARADLGSMKLAIDDRSAVRVVDIRSHARTLARKGPLAGIVVDYLQLMSSSRGDKRPRHEQVAEWSRQLKILAKEMNVPVFALSQLNRQVTGRADKRPEMSDLRESGGLEQDADVILLLHDDDNNPSALSVLVAKNRQGQTGAFDLIRKGNVARLDSPNWRPDQAAIASSRTTQQRAA